MEAHNQHVSDFIDYFYNLDQNSDKYKYLRSILSSDWYIHHKTPAAPMFTWNTFKRIEGEK